MPKSVLEEYKDNLIQRSQDDDNDSANNTDEEEDSVLDDFFNSKDIEEDINDNKSGLKRNTSKREHGDDVIYQQMSQETVPHYSRYADNKGMKNMMETSRFDSRVMSEKYKANIVPTHLKKGKTIDKNKSRYGLNRNDPLLNQMFNEDINSPNILEQSYVQEPERLEASFNASSIVSQHDLGSSYLPENEVTQNKAENVSENLTDDNEAILKELEILKEENETLKTKENEFEDKLEGYQQKIEDLNEDIFETKAKNMNLQKQVMKLTSERQRMLERIKLVDETSKKLDQDKSRRNERADELEQKLARLESRISKREANQSQKLVTEEIQRLRYIINDLEAKNAALTISLNQLRTKI